MLGNRKDNIGMIMEGLQNRRVEESNPDNPPTWIFRVYVNDNPTGDFDDYEDALDVAKDNLSDGNTVEIERQKWNTMTAYNNGKPANSFTTVWSNGKQIKGGKFIQKANESVEDLFESLREDIPFDELETTNESFFEMEPIDEAKTVTFGNNTYPKANWAVILAGGSGSGKGYVISHKIAIDAKIIDVDQLKKLYTIAAKKGKTIKDDRDYDFKNPEDVGALHDIVDKKAYKEKIEDMFYASHVNGNRPNIIYDITGSKADKLKNLGKMLKDMGYQVSLVWVLTNRQVAMMRNLCRARVVPAEIFHETHNKVNQNVFPFLQSTDAKYYDEAWVVFNSSDSLKELSAEEKKDFDKESVVKFAKKGSSFVIPDGVWERVMRTLGPQETDNGGVYVDYEKAQSELDKLATVVKDKNGKERIEYHGFKGNEFLSRK